MGGDDVVLRQRDLLALQKLLQQGLGILAQGLGIDVFQYRDVERANHRTRGLETGIEEDGAKERFQRIGQDRGTAEAAGFEFALTQAQKLRELQPLGDFIQGLLLDQVGAQARKVAFVDLVVAFEEQ